MLSAWEIVTDVRTDLGEAPLWDAPARCLWYVDIDGHAVHRLDPATGTAEVQLVGQAVGAAIPCTDGRLVLALAAGIHFASWGEQGTNLAVRVGDDVDPTVRLNDAKCDPRGRLWAGTMATDFRAGVSTLYRFDRQGATPLVAGWALANGMGWSPDTKRMYVVDSRARTIEAFDYDIADGEISRRRTWLSVPEEAGWADGMTVDIEGGVWVAMYQGSAVHRYDADGALTEVLELPVRKVTSVCFGGPELTDLYITSASAGLHADELDQQPYAGSLFVVPGAGRGVPSVRFDPSTINPIETGSSS